jgi:alkyl hydroperoxide reductase subunit AhpF
MELPASYLFKKMIREEMKKLSNPVKLLVFINKYGAPQNYEYTMSILKEYEENSNGMLTIEELLVGKNPDLDKKYNIQRDLTILFIDNEGKELIRYLAAPQGSEVQPFIQALLIFAGAPNYYEDAIKKNLNRIAPSTIKVMVTNSCVYCAQMVNIVSQFALASGGKIRAVIIDTMENPDIVDQFDASTVPYTIINEKKPLLGLFEPNEILKALIGENSAIQY